MPVNDVVIRFGGDATQLNRTVKSVEGSAEKLRGAFTRAFSAIAAGVGVAATVRGLAQAAATAEKFRRGFEQIAGSSAAARDELDYVGKTANRLGVNLGTASEAYLNLTAAAKGTALEGDNSRRIFEAVAGAMARLGRTGDETRGAMLAIEQMISKGTVSSEELRGQLGERLPGAFQAAARAMGVTTERLGDLLKQGQITADVMLPRLAAELENVYGTDAKMDTLSASWERFKNGVFTLAGTIGTALTPVFKGALDIATSFVGKLQAMADVIRLFSVEVQIAAAKLSRSFDRIRSLTEERDSLINQRRGYSVGPDGKLTIGISGGTVSGALPAPSFHGASAKDAGKLNPEFAANLEAMIAEAAASGLKIGITEGFRSTERQAEYWANALRKYGSAAEARNWVAPPGKSQHQKGMAADLSFGAGAREWAHANAGRFGLDFPLANEAWHIELQGARETTKATRELTAAMREQKQAQQERDALYREGLDVWHQTRTVYEQHAETIKKLAMLYQAGAIDMETFQRAAQQSVQTLDGINGGAEKTSEAARSLGMAMSSAFSQAMAEGANLRQILKGLAVDLVQVIMRIRVLKALEGAPQGNWVATVLGAMFGGAFANGGVVAANVPAGIYSSPTFFQMAGPGRAFANGGVGLLGEGRFAEAVVPLPDGKRIPVQMQGGGTTVEINNYASGTRAETRQGMDGRTIVDIVEAVLDDGFARGGRGWVRTHDSVYGLNRAR